MLDYIFEKRNIEDTAAVEATTASDDIEKDSSSYRESPIVYIIEIFLTILDSNSFVQSYFK